MEITHLCDIVRLQPHFALFCCLCMQITNTDPFYLGHSSSIICSFFKGGLVLGGTLLSMWSSLSTHSKTKHVGKPHFFSLVFDLNRKPRPRRASDIWCVVDWNQRLKLALFYSNTCRVRRWCVWVWVMIFFIGPHFHFIAPQLVSSGLHKT